MVTDSIQPFINMAVQEEKGVFVLVKTSNPSSVEISEATNIYGEKIRDWLAGYVHMVGKNCVGRYGYSGIGAVVGATFPKEASLLRSRMKNNFFLFRDLVHREVEQKICRRRFTGSWVNIIHIWNIDFLHKKPVAVYATGFLKAIF